MTLSGCSVREFAQKLGAKEPVPGGGGVAALAGAFGACLGSMVGQYSVGKKAFLGREKEHHAIIDKCLALSDRLLTLIDEDAANFEPLSRAYGLPANTEEEKAQKERVLQDATKIAASGPIEMVDLIYEAILLQEKLVNLSTKMILSDVGCGAEMLRAALLSAKLNVVVNLASITDAPYVAEVRKNVNRKVADGTAICDRVFDQVLTTLQK